MTFWELWEGGKAKKMWEGKLKEISGQWHFENYEKEEKLKNCEKGKAKRNLRALTFWELWERGKAKKLWEGKS